MGREVVVEPFFRQLYEACPVNCPGGCGTFVARG